MSKTAVESLRSPEYDLLLRMLRQAREASGLGQRELSRLLGKSSTYVYKVEAGTRRIDVVELIAWLKHLEVPAGEFIESYIKASNAAR